MKTNSRVKSFTFIVSLAGVAAINFIINTIAHFMDGRLPLDTIGTMLIAMECGYFPGILVAFLTNLMECTLSSSMGYVMVINVSIAALTAFFYKRDYFKRWYMVGVFILLTSALSCLFEIGLVLDSFAGISDMFFHGKAITENGEMIHNEIGLRFIYHILDKSICLLFASFIMKITPTSVKVMLLNIGWMQRPITKSQIKKITDYSPAKKSINKRIILVVVVLCTSITVVFLAISLKLFFNVTKDELCDHSISYAKWSAAEIDGNQVEDYIAHGSNSLQYIQTQEALKRIFESEDSIKELYIFKLNKAGATCIFDITDERTIPKQLGESLELPPMEEETMAALLSGEKVDALETKEKSHHYVTGFAPVFDDTHTLVCFAGAAIDMEGIYIQNQNFMFRMISLGIGFLIFMIAWTLWLAKYHLIYPIDSMVYRVGQFDFSNDEARKKNMEKFRALNIYTGSEIENLYFAFLQVVEESMINFTYFQMKTEQMNRLQTGVIYVLADLVENRDSSTGDHIKKTAAYVDVILHKMQELGYYEEQLNPIFIENCVKSAPLHDVGKIRIPDRILNKPGRLTEEEFDIMKTHAQSGANIIQQIIDTIPDSQYLYEAKRIAGCHHEKWDGTGYPQGLKGEEIPLSARVMAVADVFDALVSVRCYKKALSYDEAMDIVRKESGTHFDPKVAEAFLSAGDEVKKISEEFANGLRDLTP